jgi:hypothetical protein
MFPPPVVVPRATLSERAEVLKSILLLFHMLSLSFGSAFIFIYFYRNGFYPGALSLSDAFAILLLLFGFASVAILTVLFVTAAGLPIARSIGWLFNWGGAALPPAVAEDRYYAVWKRGLKLELAAGTFVLLFMLWAMFLAQGVEARFLIASLVLLGSFSSYITYTDRKLVPGSAPTPPQAMGALDRWFARQTEAVRKLFVIAVISAGFFGLYFATFQDIALTALGFRKIDFSVQLDKEDFARVADQAAALGLAVNPCRRLAPDSYVLDNLDLLWYQAGTRWLGRYPSQLSVTSNSSNATSFMFESAKPIGGIARSIHPRLRCEELPSDLLFEGGSGTLRGEAAGILTHRLQGLAILADGAAVTISVHDSQDRGPAGWNNLTLRQGWAVVDKLGSLFPEKTFKYKVEGVDDRVPKKSCTGLEQLALERCRAVNRRVEVRAAAVPMTP